MKKAILLLSILNLSASQAQNLPACDSLVITCCTFDSLGTNTLTIYANNYSSNLFDYPGFVLFDGAMDTIAKETVNYFGIGQGNQPHTLDIVGPLNLPFSGTLNLYTLFYSEFACSFPFTIADTVAGIGEAGMSRRLTLHPNPATNQVTVSPDGFFQGSSLMISIMDVTGRELMRSIFFESPVQLPLTGLMEGMYYISVTDGNHFRAGTRLLIAGRAE